MLSGLAARPDAAATIRRLLDESGIGERFPCSLPARVGVSRYAELYNRLVDELDDEGFALFSRPLRKGTFEFLCRAVLSSGTLADALDRSARFLRLVLPDMAVALTRLPADRVRLSLHLSPDSPLAATAVDHPARIFAFEWLLRLLHALMCWLVGRGISLDVVWFPFPRPSHADDYRLIYTEHSQFALAATPPAETRGGALHAEFAAHLLDLPTRRDEAALTSFLDGAPGKIALLYRRDRETAARVRDLLRSALPETPSAKDLAGNLNLSERTLNRRLADEGTSFRAVRNALRRDLALARLGKTAAPLSVIAAELGYADPSALYRAVIDWTGLSPTAFRARQRGKVAKSSADGRHLGATDLGGERAQRAALRPTR